MDSGNSSGSIQSSSGGEEEYDSRAAESSLAALFNNQLPFTPTTTNHLPLFPPPQQIFDPLSNYLHPTPSSSLLPNPNLICSKPFPSNQLLPQGGHNLPPANFSCVEMNSNSRNNNSNSNSNGGAGGAVRNPKKRSRASRRAPTTVLTTDTTNFRAMVQEFTGIPAPPFTQSSPFSRTRFDLFSSSSSSNHFDPPYLLRPFAQKLLPTNNLLNFTANNPFLTFQSPKYPQQSSLEIPPTLDNSSSHLKTGPVFEDFGGTNAKLQFAPSSSSSSGFHGDKGQDCNNTVAPPVTVRNQASTMESWINCSSD